MHYHQKERIDNFKDLGYGAPNASSFGKISAKVFLELEPTT